MIGATSIELYMYQCFAPRPLVVTTGINALERNSKHKP